MLNKKIFFFSLLAVFIFIIPPAIVIPILLTNKTSSIFSSRLSPHYVKYKWDINQLKTEKADRKDFIMYFGTPACPYCRELWQELEISDNFLKKIKDMHDKSKMKRLLLFSEEGGLTAGTPQQTKINKFRTDLKALLARDGLNIEGTIGVPFIVFFKNGVAKKTHSLNLGIGKDNKAEIEKFITEIKKVFPD